VKECVYRKTNAVYGIGVLRIAYTHKEIALHSTFDNVNVPYYSED